MRFPLISGFSPSRVEDQQAPPKNSFSHHPQNWVKQAQLPSIQLTRSNGHGSAGVHVHVHFHEASWFFFWLGWKQWTETTLKKLLPLHKTHQPF
mmetsp:Transcript_6010/g.10884  ORF Transcript_6010/g.10884 Transcript_6010/m.10884 type:complete len:94 (+) Transcript_6010:243-524(+)